MRNLSNSSSSTRTMAWLGSPSTVPTCWPGRRPSSAAPRGRPARPASAPSPGTGAASRRRSACRPRSRPAGRPDGCAVRTGPASLPRQAEDSRRGRGLESPLMPRYRPVDTDQSFPALEERGARALARARRLPRDAAPARGRAPVRVLRGPADRQRRARRAPRAVARLQGHLPPLQDDVRLPRPAQGGLGLSRPAGRARGRAPARHHAPSTRSSSTASRSSTSAAASRCSPTSRSGTASPSGSGSGSTSTTPT